MILIAEGLVAELDPDFQFAEALAPYARRQLVAQLNPRAVARRLERFGADLAELATDLPPRLNRILEALDSEGLEVHLRTDEMDALLARAERVGNRVAASVLAAALIDGLAQLAARRRLRMTGRRRRQGRGSGKIRTMVRQGGRWR